MDTINKNDTAEVIKDFIKDWGKGAATDVLSGVNKQLAELAAQNAKLIEANELLKAQNKVLRFEKDEVMRINSRMFNRSRNQRREIKRMNAKLELYSLKRQLKEKQNS